MFARKKYFSRSFFISGGGADAPLPSPPRLRICATFSYRICNLAVTGKWTAGEEGDAKD